ncbi:MAG: sugar-binding transcriptional regulator [Rhizobiaceae bacterium]
MKNTIKKSRTGAANKPPLPFEFQDQVMWAAWLYFVDEWTQSQIAKKIGISRVTVIKLLNEAKTRGLVSIQISPKVAAHTTTSRKLAEIFSLNAVTIIPDLKGEPLVPRLGKAGAFALAETLEKDDIIGIAWGRTVLAVAEAISLSEPIENLTVAQITGSPNGLSADFSPESCSSLLANNLGARNVKLLAPAMVSNPELRDMLLKEASIKKQFSVIRSANRILFGVGDVGRESTLRNSDLHTQKAVDKLVTNGAIAAIIGRFIDADGNELALPNQNRMIGTNLDEMRKIPHRLCVAGGPIKVKSIIAALKGGFATDLVIDQATAEYIVKLS